MFESVARIFTVTYQFYRMAFGNLSEHLIGDDGSASMLKFVAGNREDWNGLVDELRPVTCEDWNCIVVVSTKRSEYPTISRVLFSYR